MEHYNCLEPGKLIATNIDFVEFKNNITVRKVLRCLYSVFVKTLLL